MGEQVSIAFLYTHAMTAVEAQLTNKTITVLL